MNGEVLGNFSIFPSSLEIFGQGSSLVGHVLSPSFWTSQCPKNFFLGRLCILRFSKVFDQYPT